MNSKFERNFRLAWAHLLCQVSTCPSPSLPLLCCLYLPLTMAIIITNWLCLLCQALFGFLENLLILHWIKIKICLHGLRQLSSPLGSTLLPLLLWPEIVFASATAATATMNSSSNIAIFNALPQFIIFVHQLSLPSTHLPPSTSLPLPLTALKHPSLGCCCLELTENPFVATICCAKIKTFNLLLIN